MWVYRQRGPTSVLCNYHRSLKPRPFNWNEHKPPKTARILEDGTDRPPIIFYTEWIPIQDLSAPFFYRGQQYRFPLPRGRNLLFT